MKRVRPFLKWAGSKYRCLDKILGQFPAASRLIEPFTGSAAVFINTDYPNYLLAEENKDLIALFQHLQHEGEPFITYCEQFFCPDNNTASRYYQMREQFNQSDIPRARAAMFLYLNRHGYNGLCRYNQQGIYNVPFGSYIKPYFPLQEMYYFHQKCQNATFVKGDFRETFTQAKKGDLIYCDPPYAPLLQISNFSSYTHNKFGENEQIILAKLAMDCASRGIVVIISNHDTAFTRQHYQHAEIKSFSVRRSINCNTERRVPVDELLAVFR